MSTIVTDIQATSAGAASRPATPATVSRASLVTFDRGVAEQADVVRPDRRRMLEADYGTRPRIARGGGYSYSAVSFGAGSIVHDMTRFDRIIRFDANARLIEVEAGITLGDLLTVTAPAGLWLPVQPGYPAITIGGCIAANAHGKNPAQSGTFRHSIVDLTLYHPAHGTIRVDAARDRTVFDLTVGGYGLTGVIVSATLRLAPLAGSRLLVRRETLTALADGLARVRATSPGCAFTYTWHDAAVTARPFGRGLAYEGTFIPSEPKPADFARPYRRIDPCGARLPVSLWNSLTTGAANLAFRAIERLKPATAELSLFDSLFPFARRPEIFLFFGRTGFIEYQAIVPDDRAEDYLTAIERMFVDDRAPSVLISMKRFRGDQRFLRFESDGVCVTLYLARSVSGLRYLPRLDELAITTASPVNIVKDSRLPPAVARRLYPEYDDFRTALRAYDPKRLFRSEMSERLAL